MNGATLLKAISHGPFMLASLPDGRYRFSASYEGKTQQRAINITRSNPVRTLFLWPMRSDTSAK